MMKASSIVSLFLAANSFSASVAWTTWRTLPSRTPGVLGNRFPPSLYSSKVNSALDAAETPTAGSNVVLRPSTAEGAFDSYKIGGPKVHRYVRDSGDATEYVMWYHGRSLSDLGDTGERSNLAPLSTGRVGAAYSRNGLHWERRAGSDSEDFPGVSLGLNAESWWGFDTGHIGLGAVLLPMSTPAIMAEGGMYLMYYMGGTLEEEPVTAFLRDPELEGAKDQAVRGMRMKIGVAVSQDGKSWGRVEGDDHSGAIMVPYDPEAENGVFETTDDDGNDFTMEEELYCGWPEVVLNSDGKGFTMYYSAMLKGSKEKVIARAVSEDGFRFEKRGVCLRPSSDLDALGCSRCNVVKHHTYDKELSQWVESNDLIMLYEGVGSDGKHRILSTRSGDNDGKEWKAPQLVLDTGDDSGSAPAWDSKAVGSPHILRLDDGTIRLYYCGIGANGATAIGVAFGPSEEGPFQKDAVQVSFSDSA